MRGKCGILDLKKTAVSYHTMRCIPWLRIEAVGDSITCGFGNEAPSPMAAFLPEEENGWNHICGISRRRAQRGFLGNLRIRHIHGGLQLRGSDACDAGMRICMSSPIGFTKVWTILKRHSADGTFNRIRLTL
jgi:hypothetical protein